MNEKYILKDFGVKSKSIYIYQLDNTGMVVACNENFLSLLTKPQREQLLHKRIWDIFLKNNQVSVSVKDNNLQVLLSGVAAMMKEHFFDQKGNLTEYMAHKIPLITETSDQGLLSFLVKSPMQLESDTNMTTLALDHMISNLPGHVYWKNKGGVYLGCNDTQAHSLGLQNGTDVVGKTDFELPWLQSSAEAFRKHDIQVMQSGKPLLTEEPATIEGRDATVLSHKIPLKNKLGKIVGVLGMSLDITKQKEMEIELKNAKDKAEMANDAKTEFLCNMRHDLRTPFSGILSLAKCMEETETDTEKKTTLGYISESARVLLDYLNEILEFVQLEDGQLPILDKKFDLHELLNNLNEMMLPAAKEKRLILNVVYDSTVPQFVVGDRMRTQRILINLVSNALKFTNEGAVNVTVSIVNEGKNNILIKFIVQDTGMGIPKDKRDIIFERFNRLTSSYSGVYTGKGLGLRAVKRFLDEIDGEIDVEGEVNKGSVFTVLIPYKTPLESIQKSV